MDDDDILDFDGDFDDIDCFEKVEPQNSQDELYSSCLEKYFGHTQFRPMQRKIINSIIEDKRDNCAIMATGYGKSLCFQFPSVYLNTVTLIVSPLISLMEDQVLGLKLSNIKACLLGSAQKDRSILDEVLACEYNLVYLTPEYITGDMGARLLKSIRSRLTLIAIDEAHCISQWGHDFRSAFRSLGIIRTTCPEVPILAMTATATVRVRDDIVNCLKLRNPQILCTGFDRPNLEFIVRQKKQNVWEDVGQIIQTVKIGSTIIYCITKKHTEEIAENIKRHGIKCSVYHAGLTLSERKRVHESFSRDEIRVIVATIAFGMGINKPDVRLVIHYGAAKDIESYYQEVGRAGRDGMHGKCIMFYANSDFQLHNIIRAISIRSEKMNKNLSDLSMKIRDYINTVDCRRKFILDYFQDSAEHITQRKNCCDNCARNCSGVKLSDKYLNLNTEGLFDFTKDTVNLLTAIEAFNGRTGLKLPLLLLRGSKSKDLSSHLYSNLVYGAGKSKPEEWYKSLALLLEDHHYLKKDSLRNDFKNKFGKIYLISITDKGRNWLNNKNRSPLKLRPLQDMYRFMSLKPQTSVQPSTSRISKIEATPKQSGATTEDILKLLLRVRSSLASKFDVMPYIVASNRALSQMAMNLPLSVLEMKNLKLDGFSDVKIEKFGPKFVKCILEFKNLIPSGNDALDAFSKDSVPNNSLRSVLEEYPLPGVKLTSTHIETYDLFSAGKSVEEIARLRGLAESTILNYISVLIKAGYIERKRDLVKFGVDSKTFQLIAALVQNNLFGCGLKEIKDKCPPYVTYDMIKYVVGYYQIRQHLKQLNVNFIDPDESVTDKCDLLSNSVNAHSEQPNFEETSNAQQNCTTSQPKDIWDSDIEFDINEIDAIEKAETTIVLSNSSNNSGEILELVDSQDESENRGQIVNLEKSFEEVVEEQLAGNDELDMLISCVKKVEEEEQTQQKHKNIILKRKYFKEKQIMYDSSGDEEEKHVTVKKRTLPSWIPNAQSPTSKKDTKVRNKKFL